MGITTGMVNSTYTSFGDDLPSILAGYIPAVPMVALAVAEAGRVPLASVIYHKHKFIQLIAILGILALGYLLGKNFRRRDRDHLIPPRRMDAAVCRAEVCYPFGRKHGRHRQ